MAEKQRRKTELTLVCGINGTGKSTWLKKNIVEKGGRVIVCTPDYSEWTDLPVTRLDPLSKIDTPHRVIYESPRTIDTLCRTFHGGTIILDDAMAYLTFQTPEALQWIYVRHRQAGVDIYIVGHGLRQFPPRVFTFAQWLVLFNSVENFSARRKDVREDIYNKVIEAQKRIAGKVAAGEPFYHEIILFDDQIRGRL